MRHDLDSSVSDWLIDHPELLLLFERRQIEYTCGGKSLEYACRQRGIDPVEFLAELNRFLETRRAGDSR
jgi:iron-sulfur cluster repair protein YtfE (RIC family)